MEAAILACQTELGFTIVQGCIKFDFLLFDRGELLREPAVFNYLDTAGQPSSIELSAGSLGHSICQETVIYQASDHAEIQVHLNNGQVQQVEGLVLDLANSRHIFERDSSVHHLAVSVPTNEK